MAARDRRGDEAEAERLRTILASCMPDVRKLQAANTELREKVARADLREIKLKQFSNEVALCARDGDLDRLVRAIDLLPEDLRNEALDAIDREP